MIKNDGWTYGAEHEFADWDRRLGLPEGFTTDPEKTIVNSNGVAWAKDWDFGGEFNTPPTSSPEGQITHLEAILKMHPDCAVNYRCNLHVHVRIPGLRENLQQLKALAEFNRFWLPAVLPLIEPIPKPTPKEYPDPEAFKGAMKRYRRRKVSHQTILGQDRLERQLRAKTVKGFFEAEVPWTKPTMKQRKTGSSLVRPKKPKPMWHAQARAAVNVRQLLQTDTLEFRHFPGTLDAEELLTAVEWCRDYLKCVFNIWDPTALFVADYAARPWPKFEPYDHWLEERWLLTSHEKNKNKRSMHEYRQKFRKSPCVVPR